MILRSFLLVSVIFLAGCQGPVVFQEPDIQKQCVEESDDAQTKCLEAEDSSTTMTDETEEIEEKTAEFTEISEGFKYRILKEGNDNLRPAQAGDNLRVQYIGTFTNGKQFDSSYQNGRPFSFTLGGGQVIQGWDQGVVGMLVGERRELIIPSRLGYGGRAVGNIPPNSTLVFSIELVQNLSAQ